MTLSSERRSQLKAVIIQALEIREDQFHENLSIGEVPRWDSLGHMNLIFSIEDRLGVQFHSEDIPKLKSVKKIIEALDS